jgi:hypothetical protein
MVFDIERNYESTVAKGFLLMYLYPIWRYLGISLQKTDKQKLFIQRSRLTPQNKMYGFKLYTLLTEWTEE